MTDYAIQREFTRVPVHIWGTFAIDGRELLTAEITMLSLRGCYASTFGALPVGSCQSLTLFTEDDTEALHITVESRVVRSSDDGMGIEFVEMPLESYDHLRRLVLLNSTNPEQVEQEFRSHIGLRRAV